MAVVIQQMVPSDAAGVLFTADPVTCNRTVCSVEASFGLGEALVSGRVTPDVYKVRGGEVVERTISAKRLAIQAAPTGGTHEHAIALERRQQPALTDAQVVELARLGRRIEAHFGCPQDIEWCLAGGEFFVVQSRPITTLFPIPPAGDDTNRVYVSVGHQQMMTDPMKPLGLSIWQLTTPRPMSIAGGRLFVDVTQILAAPASRATLLELFGKGDPLLRDALETVIERGDFLPAPPEGFGAAPAAPLPAAAPAESIEPDPARVTELIAETQASLARLRHDIRGRSGPELFEFILADLQELRRLLFDPRSHRTFMSAMDAAWWLNEQLEDWLGEKNAADKLSQSVPNNVTSEMGLALLDVADVIRPHPQLVEFLEQVGDDDGFLDELAALEGGAAARDAIEAYLERYGMRCTGEVDITRPRWSERPSTLVPLILGNVRSFEPGAGKRRFEQGREEAREKEQELLERLRALPDGEQKAREAKRRIDLVRTFMGYREYPKYGMISRYFIYKQALLREAERLVGAGVLRDAGGHLLPHVRGAPRRGAHEPGGLPADRRARAGVPVVRRADAAARADLRRRVPDGEPPAGRPAGRRAGGPAGLSRHRRGPGARRPRPGGRRPRGGRHPGHRLHRPQLDARLRRCQRPRDRGGRPDDPWLRDRARVRPARDRRRGQRHPADP